ncbi:hypothetical protein [uncultured Muribaculum sp.]|uniref:hypothetical protein n=1 Tax=uncultured Muribaculum sp. TaxID=1918613 RepID=UPI00266F4527|nr:hypothetical protein [uncultured Muribaculum sp.]
MKNSKKAAASSLDIKDEYNLLFAMLKSAYVELRDMSKKSPKDSLSLMKVRMLNRILERVKTFLKNEATLDFLDLIDEDTIPSTSDALLLMSQYAGAIENYYNRYHIYTDRMVRPDFSK